MEPRLKLQLEITKGQRQSTCDVKTFSIDSEEWLVDAVDYYLTHFSLSERRNDQNVLLGKKDVENLAHNRPNLMLKEYVTREGKEAWGISFSQLCNFTTEIFSGGHSHLGIPRKLTMIGRQSKMRTILSIDTSDSTPASELEPTRGVEEDRRRKKPRTKSPDPLPCKQEEHDENIVTGNSRSSQENEATDQAASSPHSRRTSSRISSLRAKAEAQEDSSSVVRKTRSSGRIRNSSQHLTESSDFQLDGEHNEEDDEMAVDGDISNCNVEASIEDNAMDDPDFNASSPDPGARTQKRRRTRVQEPNDADADSNDISHDELGDISEAQLTFMLHFEHYINELQEFEASSDSDSPIPDSSSGPQAKSKSFNPEYWELLESHWNRDDRDTIAKKFDSLKVGDIVSLDWKIKNGQKTWLGVVSIKSEKDFMVRFTDSKDIRFARSSKAEIDVIRFNEDVYKQRCEQIMHSSGSILENADSCPIAHQVAQMVTSRLKTKEIPEELKDELHISDCDKRRLHQDEYVIVYQPHGYNKNFLVGDWLLGRVEEVRRSAGYTTSFSVFFYNHSYSGLSKYDASSSRSLVFSIRLPDGEEDD
ncbi:hypothetical protein GUITHDRAFT_165745 [Guillardia theta CCMP2712]|uniref:Uncharacterized protein n=2 Tax=Guillardia theta TaxID=55529 RepID=L1IL01_GUITC|nr:hypothetical protein GUITHDRAFT_165745 [Guillardia theta CCMP2712]EKX36475.1 hypothetical protein GUITHDRAFT_165745 [Guillardia theta CCMP2712]|eukprot:XP_005823455.1 hypothetical protein GUITHDRAFT_165745 [Guillardia theta CCMP2712]